MENHETGEVDIIKRSIFMRNQLKSLAKEFDVYLKVPYKRRELSCNLDILSVRYNLKSDNFINFWMHFFIISHA